MANYSELLSRAIKTPEPVFKGEWATIVFRPDLASQQEFVIGIAAAIIEDEKPYVKWIPSFAKISGLYGESISINDARDLITGSEQAIQNSFTHNIRIELIDCGTPHIKLVPCGYIATNDIEKELVARLKRHAYAVWQEVGLRETAMDDNWAYLEMKRSIAQLSESIWLPQRKYTIATKSFDVQLDNGQSFGAILSARHSSFATVEKHITASLIQVLGAHRATERKAPPALFVVLPDKATPNEPWMAKKTRQLLGEIEDAGILSVAEPRVESLAKELEKWAGAAL